MRRSGNAILVLALAPLPACHLPTPMRAIDDPRLARVHDDYARAVDALKASRDEDWYSGWMGNIWRNTWGGNRRGLCYEWQARTYEAVREVAPAEGFDAIGIMRDRDRPSEHHGVLLIAHGAGTGPRLMEAPPPRAGWVLDPWRYGRADVFTLDEWLGLPESWVGRIEFEDLEAEYQERQNPTTESPEPEPLKAPSPASNAAPS